MQSIFFNTATDTWAEKSFRVMDGSDHLLIAIPLAFGESGRCNSVQYALSAVDDCWEEQDGHLCDTEDQPFHADDPLSAGMATLHRSDGNSPTCLPSHEPRFKQSRRAPIDGSDEGAVSNSSLSSVMHSGFLVALISRHASFPTRITLAALVAIFFRNLGQR